jgi:AraC-like DNA-binding protein
LRNWVSVCKLCTVDHTVPANQALQLIELVKPWGIAAEQLLSPLQLSERALEEPNARLPIGVQDALLRHARQLTQEPALGVHLGLRRRASMYGFLGFAAMTASSLREAIELAVKFSSVVTTAIALRLVVERDVAALRFEEHADPGDVRDIVHLSLVIGLGQIGQALTGFKQAGNAELAIPRPAYWHRFEHMFQMRFDQPVTQLVFDAAALDLPLVMPDRAGMRLAREQCERALGDLSHAGMIVSRVRGLIANADRFRTLDEVAAGLGVSARTLKRRLAAQHLSFSELVEEERHQRALLLLRSTQLSLEDITERLGYSTVPNFARAFRRWAGVAPGAYRRARADLLATRRSA